MNDWVGKINSSRAKWLKIVLALCLEHSWFWRGPLFYFFLFIFPSTSSALVRVEKILIEVGAKCVAGITLLMLRMIIRKESRMCRLRGVGAPPFPPPSVYETFRKLIMMQRIWHYWVASPSFKYHFIYCVVRNCTYVSQTWSKLLTAFWTPPSHTRSL